MFRDLYEIIRDFLKGVVTSRLFVLAVLFIWMFGTVVFRLFQLQIVQGEEYLNNYKLDTKKTITIPSTRGNIYDRNGYLLAYNQLAYSVTVTNTGDYKSTAALNRMLLELVRILNKNTVVMTTYFEVTITGNGEFAYTTTSESAKKRFLKSVYGLKSVDQLDKDNKNPSDITAKELFERMAESYKIIGLEDESKNPIEMTAEEILSLVNLRYALSQVAYTSYLPTNVAADISYQTVADILENQASLLGVKIEEETIRRYNDSIYFSSIIGYTGKVRSDADLAKLKENDESYDINDMVGRIGLEEVLEYELHGTKGSQDIVKDSKGRILEITSSTEPVAGNDMYLTLDRNYQVGIYKRIEQQLAGILSDKIKNKDIVITENTDSTTMQIPVKKAYFQLINNNVLSISRFASYEASETEQQIYSKYVGRESVAREKLREQLNSTASAASFKSLSEEMQSYMKYVPGFLNDHSILVKSTTKNEEGEELVFAKAPAWTDSVQSLREYLLSGIEDNWIDTSKLSIDSKYSSTNDIYMALVDYIIEHIQEDVSFNKLVYKYMIEDTTLTGRELCLALFDQGVLNYDEEAVAKLKNGGSAQAYNFFMEKISKIELTPAQLALDPCSGFSVVTNVKTGEVIAMVSYPGYDNNKFSGRVDPVYYNQLDNDLSLPLFNNAAKVKTAPGSTFKPLMAIAGLEEGTVRPNELINDTGIFTEVKPPVRCSVYPSSHGHLNVVGALMNSCNYYFNEIGYRFSLDSQGVYNEQQGVAKIQKYVRMFGLDRKSGVEVGEAEPSVTDVSPVHSAIGQGTSANTTVQLARYATALANRGTIYNLSMKDKMTDVNGNLIEDYTPEVLEVLDIKASTWNLVQEGMHKVITEGSAKNIFSDLEVSVAGKTGTAQENRLRGNHGLFISFGPYEDPEISVTVQIPFGYSSANAAEIAKDVYRLYYGYDDLDEVINGGATSVSGTEIRDY